MRDECAGSADSGTPIVQIGGGGAHPTSALSVGKAHQRVVREAREAEDADVDLFGKPWESTDRCLKRSTVREVSLETARVLIEKYEWMGCLAAVTWHAYGIYFGGLLGGVVTYGPEYSENLGAVSRATGKVGADWSKYGYEGKMILLSRGACAHWTPNGAASRLIRISMRLLPAKYEVVTATVDAAAGEIGTVYQAAGFDYVGSMRDGNPNVQFRPKDRHGWRINGKIVGARSMRQRIGTTKWADIQRHYPNAEVVMQYSKARYFAFRGPNAATLRSAIAHKIGPYPKRAAL